MSDRKFPIHPHAMRDEDWFPRSIPWAAAERFREQALTNHSQTLERLAERGGLAPNEIYLAYSGQRLRHLSALENAAAIMLVVKLSESVDGVVLV